MCGTQRPRPRKQPPKTPVTTPKPEPVTAEYNFKLLGLFGYEQFSYGTHIKGCSPKVKECPPGHEINECEDDQHKAGYICTQCTERTFQSDNSRPGDRCRLRRYCNKPHMEYRHGGTTTKDAQCQCKSGYHYENDDQRACVPNRLCGKGYGQGEYGVCLQCIKHGMYSDRADRYTKCRAQTNCHKQGRCIMKKSNGIDDNTCGEPVEDLSKCSELSQGYYANMHDNISTGVIVGCVLGAAAVFVIILLLILYLRRHLSSKSSQGRSLSKEQLEEILQNIIMKSEKDDIYCRKVLGCYFSEIENKIDRQIWTLAQELFKDHFQAAKYEIIVEKYKENQLKFAINGYLQEWQEWRGETAEAVSELLKCLKQCGREDITYGICSKFQEENDEHLFEDSTHSRKTNFCQHFMQIVCQCMKKKPELPTQYFENRDPTNKLLDAELEQKEPGKVYQDRPCPSAPVSIEQDSSSIEKVEYKGTISYPIQASS
ncbi:hypothetical protein ScPMuIL_007471 [Solemya velum]